MLNLTKPIEPDSEKVQRFSPPSFYVMSAIDLTVEEPRGSRGNPIDVSADNAKSQATEANQITQHELEILQKEVFEEQESTHQKMITKRLEELLNQAQDNGWVVAKDDDEFYVNEDTGECQALKPIYAANVGRNITDIAWAAYKTTSNAGGSLMAREWI
jgi:hypothetical protein